MTSQGQWFRDFRDLAAALTRHSWLALSYALGLVVIIYTLGLWSSTSLLFLAFQVPTLASVIFVTSRNPALRIRLPLLWVLTAVITWSYNIALAIPTKVWPVDVFSAGTILLAIYWLVLAVRASKEEFKKNKADKSTTTALAWLLSAWGATLQVAFLVLVPFGHFAGNMLPRSIVGRYLVSTLEVIRLTSPATWFPSGVFILGLTFFAVLRFADKPYRALDYKEVLPTDFPHGLNEIVAAIRIPVWLVVVIVGFLGHFVMLLAESFFEFGDKWAGRLVLILGSLVFPVAALLAAHFAFFGAMSRVNIYMASGVVSFSASAALLVVVHLLVLLGLFLYVVAVGPMGMNVSLASLAEAVSKFQEYLRCEGFLAAQATGKAFCLYGIVFLAVPLATLIPGGSRWGIFSASYTAMIVAIALPYSFRKQLGAWWERRKSRKTAEAQVEERKAS